MRPHSLQLPKSHHASSLSPAIKIPIMLPYSLQLPSRFLTFSSYQNRHHTSSLSGYQNTAQLILPITKVLPVLDSEPEAEAALKPEAEVDPTTEVIESAAQEEPNRHSF